MKKKEISILAIGATLLVIAYFYLDTSNTLFGVITNPITPVNWDEVRPREIVKNSIPIQLLEKNDNSCKVSAETFDLIINHQYFVKSAELADKLKYDSDAKTLIIPCDKLQGDKSWLNVWYVIPEAPKHALKYEYFVTQWEEPSN